MGSGSSCTRVERFDKGNQVPSRLETKSTRFSSPRNPLVFQRFPSESTKRQVSTQDDIFQLDSNLEEYSSIWDQDTKLSSTFQKSVISNLEHHQKEILNYKRSQKNSTAFDSAHIESTIDTETHSCINLSSSEKINELIRDLNNIHTQLDAIIKHRTEQISHETESVLSHILSDTQEKQQRLLNYAKEQQFKQDEHCRKLLQDYISHLDEIKAKNFSDLQNQLQIYRNQILEESQIKIMTVNDQANSAKAKILRDEQQQATEKIDSIISQLQQISADDKLQHLGNESITKTNIITNTTVGTKAPGQNCIFDFNQNDSPEQHSNPINTRASRTRKQH